MFIAKFARFTPSKYRNTSAQPHAKHADQWQQAHYKTRLSLVAQRCFRIVENK